MNTLNENIHPLPTFCPTLCKTALLIVFFIPLGGMIGMPQAFAQEIRVLPGIMNSTGGTTATTQPNQVQTPTPSDVRSHRALDDANRNIGNTLQGGIQGSAGVVNPDTPSIAPEMQDGEDPVSPENRIQSNMNSDVQVDTDFSAGVNSDMNNREPVAPGNIGTPNTP